MPRRALLQEPGTVTGKPLYLVTLKSAYSPDPHILGRSVCNILAQTEEITGVKKGSKFMDLNPNLPTITSYQQNSHLWTNILVPMNLGQYRDSIDVGSQVPLGSLVCSVFDPITHSSLSAQRIDPRRAVVEGTANRRRHITLNTPAHISYVSPHASLRVDPTTIGINRATPFTKASPNLESPPQSWTWACALTFSVYASGGVEELPWTECHLEPRGNQTLAFAGAERKWVSNGNPDGRFIAASRGSAADSHRKH
ncbi:hypothetical protein CPB85DRAFT_1454251, partial [Mucidula mucida]